MARLTGGGAGSPSKFEFGRASEYAGGQLDRRIPQRDPRTEVGQLSLALNGMLTQVQQALACSESSAAKARTSEERMRRFITDASHELRTPLTTIRGFAELYRQGAARDVSMLLSRIESDANRMGLLIDAMAPAYVGAPRRLEAKPLATRCGFVLSPRHNAL